MRLLKAQNTNLRSITGKGVKYDIDDQIIMDSTNVLLVPKGTTLQRPASPVPGHLRFNTTDGQLEVYEAGTWYNLANTAPAGVGNNVTITQQNLGNGDATNTVFGPLDSGDPNFPVPAAAQNILVLVENVFQIATTNYTLEQNPAAVNPGAETSAGSFTIGVEYKIVDPGDTDFTLIGAADSNADTVFTATGDGAGTGTARETGYYLQFTSPVDLAKPVTVLHNFDR